jgi:flagellar biosynthesis protein FlhA
MGDEISFQLFSNPKPVYFGSGIVAGLGMIPGFPKFSFFLLAGTLGFIAYSMAAAAKDRGRTSAGPSVSKDNQAVTPDKATTFLRMDALAVEIGYGLIGIVDVQQGGDFLNRIRSIRKQAAQDFGIIVPPVNVSDNLKLGAKEYAILLKGVQIARGELMVDKLLARGSGRPSRV